MPNDIYATGVAAKLKRATDLIVELKRALTAYLAKEPFKVETRAQSDGAEDMIFRLKLDVPGEIPAILGDVVHNMMSALDHLVYHLALRGSASPEQLGNLYFPTSTTKQEFELGPLKRLAGLKLAERDLIASFEPYGGGRGAILHGLKKLDILDKHKLILPVVTSAERLRIGVPAPADGQTFTISARVRARYPLRDGDTVMSNVSVRTADHGITGGAFSLVFDDETRFGGQPIFDVVIAIRKMVCDVVNACQLALPDDWRYRPDDEPAAGDP